ncbi:acetyl-coenzyme A transporter 1 isoform X2 [Arctopsyche grandis]
MASSRRRKLDKTRSLENGDEDDVNQPSNINGDRLNIALLLFLYTLQGIPLGLGAAIPMLLQNRGISYKQQAEFSFVNWPFSMKLLWAPIVDALYWSKFGRRKTWMVPAQYLLGFGMLFLSMKVDFWLEGEPDMMLLTMGFFTLNFLAATQDIAVDGWALTMLKRCNVGHASTCNSVGQTAGYFLGYVVFMALESANFCNSYLRSEPQDVGIITLSEFLYMWGWVFIVTTTLVVVIKSENEPIKSGQPVMGWRSVTNAYHQLYRITRLPSVKTLALILLTAKVGFSSSDAVSGLKLVEAGVPREQLALMIVPLVPIQVILPLILSKHSTGNEPLNSWLNAYPWRVLFGLVAAMIVAITPFMIRTTPMSIYFVLLLCLYAFHQVCLFSMFVSVMAFFARVSDPIVGGTYMTLLNTLSNLGSNWPNTLALWAVDPLTYRNCVNSFENATMSLMENTCDTLHAKELCAKGGGTCVTSLDGFYVETVLCFILGGLWFLKGSHAIKHLQRLPLHRWHLTKD